MSLTLARKTDQVYIRPSEGAGTTTLVSTDNKRQLFNLSAARTCVLPSANIKAGDTLMIENRTNFTLTLQASGGLDLTVANSVNVDASINIGRVEVIALQDSPTLASHWRTLSVEDSGTLAYAGTNSGTGNFDFVRRMTLVTCSWTVSHSSAGGSNTSAGFLPVRLRTQAFRNNIYIMTGNPQYIDRCEFAADGTVAMTHQLVQTTPSSPNATQFIGFMTYTTTT